MRKSSLALSLCALTLLPITRAVEFAFTDTWLIDENDMNTDWSYGSNWESGNVPTTDGTADVYFPSTLFFDYENFDGPEHFSIGLENDVDVNSITFSGDVDYSFYSSLTSATVTIRDFVKLEAGIFDSEVAFGFGLDVILDGYVTFDIGYGSELEITGSVFNGAEETIEITGGSDGVLLLSNDNTHSLNGRILVLDGTLGLAYDEAAGSAIIELGDAESPSSVTPGLMAVDGDRSIDNDIIVNGRLRTYEDDEGEYELTLAGEIRLNADTVIENRGGLLSLDGDIVEASPGTSISVDADEPVLFGGTSGFTGGLSMQAGAAIFTDLNALPAGPSGSAFTSTNTDTYIGLLIDSESDRDAATPAFLSLFDPAGFTGIIGFDTDPDQSGAINTYTSPIDLTGMSAASIGSVTVAELTGDITPPGTEYNFGGGGGTLLVGSLLEDKVNFNFPASEPQNGSATTTPADIEGPSTEPRGISVSSEYDQPLTVYINNALNSFTGDATAQNSALIFGNAPGTLPTNVTLRPLQGGYIGLQDTTRSIADYLNQFDPNVNSGIVGFDSQDRQTKREITDTIDLSRFVDADPDFYVGSSTWTELSGDIILPGAIQEYRLTGYKGGRLEVTSILADTESFPEDTAISAPRSVRIGDMNSKATYGAEFPGSDGFLESSVSLSGANTYSGGTYLEAGGLYISNNNSLGTGPLIVDSSDARIDGFFGSPIFSFGSFGFDETPQRLIPETADLLVANNIQLSDVFGVNVSYNFDESIDLNLELSGGISGGGGLLKAGDGTLTLSGNNGDFTGGIFIETGTVNINSDTAAGLAPIGFGNGYNAAINFNSPSPTVGGFYQLDFDEDDFNTALIPSPNNAIESTTMGGGIVTIAENTELTLDVSGFELAFSGQITGPGSLAITGEGTQELDGFNDFAGGLTVKEGANIRVGNSFSLGNQFENTPSVTLDGGSLQLDVDDSFESTSIPADIQFGPEGGEIRGNGTLSFANTLELGEGSSVSPGNSIGALRFDGPVEFGELGFLDVEIGTGEGMNTLVADAFFANEINVTATSTSPYSISVRGEDGNVPFGFDSNSPYTWIIVGSFTGVTNFSLTNFDLNIANDLMIAGGEGLWGLSIGSSGFALGGDLDLTDNLLLLSFTPVPEPSTFALFAIGLAIIGMRFGRRRRV